MKVTNYEFSVLLRMFDSVKDAAQAKILFEAWLDENYYSKVFKEAWLQFCDEYDIEDDHWYDEENGV